MNVKVTQFHKVFEYDSKALGCPTRSKNNRLSLAYGQLDEIPKEIISQIAKQIEFLDLSYNEFKNLTFLREFTELKTLILDRNLQLDHTTFPFLQNLEVLWLNNCNLVNISDWLQQLQVQCPNLRQLSMMCNPVGQTQLNGVTGHEEDEYRKQVVKMLPQLRYFDGASTAAVQQGVSADSKFSLDLLDEVFRRKLSVFKDFSVRLERSFKQINNLNESLFVRTLSITAK